MTTYLGKSCSFSFCKLSSVYVFSYFPFGFEGRIWDLIVSVPDHCLSFYLAVFISVGLGRSFFVCCLAHRGSTVGFLLLQCSSGVVRHPRDLEVSVATHFCRVLIFASS